MTILITGAAGFIGFHVCRALLNRGEHVLGVDNLNDSYDVSLKAARLSSLQETQNFRFEKIDIADMEGLRSLINRQTVDRIVHLAAQAGVRESFDKAGTFLQSNVKGHFNILELGRRLKNLKHLVYASTSSVYGDNLKTPFSTDDRVDEQISFYALTKRIDEIMSEFYVRLHSLPITGLRFFTVYGPWGRPDMALFLFTKAILSGKEVHIFNNGDIKRDFVYIDDLIQGILNCLDRPTHTHKLYNLGSARTEPVLHMLTILENTLQRKANIVLLPMQKGDVKETVADITVSRTDLNFDPRTTIDQGIPAFVEWYRQHYRI